MDTIWFDFREILTNNYIAGIIASLLAYIGASFLNPRLSKFFKASLCFVFLKYQHWLLTMFGTFSLYYFFNIPLDLAILLSISVVVLFSLVFHLKFSPKIPALIYFGTFYENEKIYLDKNFQTERIDLIIHEEIEKFNQHSYLNKMNILRIIIADIPEFYIIPKNLISINSFFKKTIKDNIVFGFSFFINQEDIIYKSYLNLDNLDTSASFKENIDAIQEVLDNNNLNEREKINLAIKINLMVITQSFNDMFLRFKDLSSLNFSLQDNIKLINEVKQITQEKNITSRNVVMLINNFECSYYRYKAILEFEKNNYDLAINYIVKSLDLNPYFPYNNYEEFKRLFATRYYLEMTSNLWDIYECDTEIFDQKPPKAEIEEFQNILSLRIESNIVLFTIDIVAGYILSRELTDKEIELIEKKLAEINNDVAKLLFKTEILKILPKGHDKLNNLYLERLEESIEILTKIYELDNSFSLITHKIGILKTILGVAKGDDGLISEGTALIKLGFEELKSIGLDLTKDE
ncbi:hypothetical protein [Moraxella nasicaprae]|uniref:Uncharacterized protein n=1 Tax=Moraxella nasicaprae TaxID=2904122 RepID=A0ABY6F5U3_9GAMM|nr:hypothetical protein [Moraxella nasicaprae]UXZ05443.1 hypothetical protein LU297_03045 [Moraxella nasicaprae]